MKVYLCGPINGRTDAECSDWRARAKELLAPLEAIDPMRRDYRGRENERGIDVEIVEGDIEDITKCIALLMMFDKPSVGTSMEVRMAAAEFGIPVYVVNASAEPLSPWLTYHATEIFTDLRSACMAIVAGAQVQ